MTNNNVIVFRLKEHSKSIDVREPDVKKIVIWNDIQGTFAFARVHWTDGTMTDYYGTPLYITYEGDKDE